MTRPRTNPLATLLLPRRIASPSPTDGLHPWQVARWRVDEAVMGRLDPAELTPAERAEFDQFNFDLDAAVEILSKVENQSDAPATPDQPDDRKRADG